LNKKESRTTFPDFFRIILFISIFILTGALPVFSQNARTGEVYNCNDEQNRDKPVTLEMTLSKKLKAQSDEITRAVAAGPSMRPRLKFFPFLDPPMNLGIGKCVSAEAARFAIREAMAYNRGVDRLIMQEVMPHHWIKIGATDLSELSWIPITPEELERLSDPSLTTEAFQELYRKLATPKERNHPFGMGSEKIAPAP